uniref:Uncharacterized protein n=1 Tax=Aeromonas phage vB_AdhaM_G2 TaxID=3238786 RepID=A0AB39TZ51_9CAUD
MKIDLTNLDVEHLETITLIIARSADIMTRLTQAKKVGCATFELSETELKDLNTINLGITE